LVRLLATSDGLDLGPLELFFGLAAGAGPTVGTGLGLGEEADPTVGTGLGVGEEADPAGGAGSESVTTGPRLRRLMPGPGGRAPAPQHGWDVGRSRRRRQPVR
jgi:hypothetical protein